MKVGIIGYLNSLAYRVAADRLGLEVVSCSPRECGLLFAAGDLEAALVPTLHARLLLDRGLARPDVDFGLAVDGPTWSTFLIGSDDLTDPGFERLFTNGDSSSMAALSQVLLCELYGHPAVVVDRGEVEEGRAQLLIGDEALRRYQRLGPQAGHDLGDLWHRWTGKPFVYARWLLSPAMPDARVAPLLKMLEGAEALIRGTGLEPHIVAAASKATLKEDLLSDYLRRFSYRLSPRDVEGERFFHSRFAALREGAGGEIPTAWDERRSSLALAGGPYVLSTDDTSVLRRKLHQGRRLDRSDIVQTLTSFPASDLFSAAHARRTQVTDPSVVTFVVDTNPNYSNVCDANCSFCAFYRPTERSQGAYLHSVDAMVEKFAVAAAAGATTILLQGGHHPSLPLSYYVELVRRTREILPGVTPHFFSAGEVRKMAEVSRHPLVEVLEALRDAGQVSLPGGGAEVLVDRVRKRISPLKGSAAEWLDVHRQAHGVGMKSTATLMYGHVEAAEDIADHILAVRDLQDETGGFTAFIPWSFKPGPTPLARRLKTSRQLGAGAYLRVLATARLALDNLNHIQGSFFSEGWDAGEAALRCGADDVGGILLEENVHRAAGYENPTSLQAVTDRIKQAGFTPVQRDTEYNLLLEAAA